MTEQPTLSLILCLPVIFILSIPVSYIYDIGKMVSNSWGYKRNPARASIFTWIPTFTLGEVHPGILKNTHYLLYLYIQNYSITLLLFSSTPFHVPLVHEIFIKTRTERVAFTLYQLEMSLTASNRNSNRGLINWGADVTLAGLGRSRQGWYSSQEHHMRPSLSFSSHWMQLSN